MSERKLSVQFYKYNSRDYLFGWGEVLKAGDVIEMIEFNTDTQLYDILVKREETEKEHEFWKNSKL